MSASVSTRPVKPRSAWKTVVTLAVIGLITVWAGVGVGADLGDIIDNWGNATGKLIQLMQPDYWFFPETVDAILETLQMAVIATAIGAAISFPVSFAASRVTNPNRPLLTVVRGIMNVVRAVPDLLYAAVLVAVVGTGALSGILALIVFNVGIIVKLVSEALDSVDRGPQEAALAAGGSWIAADRSAVAPQIFPAFVSQSLYTLELNVRASAVIGLVGAGGLGMLIDNVRTFYKYHQLSLIILEILVIVLALELLSSWARRKLVG
ncbi:phosphonate ABC transporter, permease protein PhnE [Rhodococcoides fascians]|uniref:phosphonate ABC transporter, permease protein PhnE n=1 Tax=Rhodococcoides fascians TaxID=1828 RepID=UPI00050C5302|nr:MULTISPECIES: phosphonate ABC transporter, permease protein PhnE [Rhodococcus]